MTRTDGLLVVLLSAALLAPSLSSAQPVAKPAPELSRQQMRDFLLTAKITRSRDIGRGVTSPKRLTLTDGVVTHDAAFQAVDESKLVFTSRGTGGGPTTELNFVDAYRYNLAAYAIAEVLGLDHMMPVHVERKWDGKKGSLSWWVETLMDEGERLRKKIQPPVPADWNAQMFRMRVFAALIRDTDRNLGNVLITPDWKVVMIDFTRAFRLQSELLYLNDLGKIDKALLAKLEALTAEAVQKAVGEFLNTKEIDAVMKRRDNLVAHYKGLIAKLGARAILY